MISAGRWPTPVIRFGREYRIPAKTLDEVITIGIQPSPEQTWQHFIGSQTRGTRHTTKLDRPPPVVLSVAEVAKLLRVTPAVVYKSVRDGSLPFPVIRVGRTIRIPFQSVNRIIAGNRGTPAWTSAMDRQALPSDVDPAEAAETGAA